MKTVKEVSKIAGISVRTLHHYDAIGLLKPAAKTTAGYRLYDEAALHRLQNILLFRQLRFPLRQIKAILDDPSFDPQQALTEQIKLLELQRNHIDQILSFARQMQQKGGNIMDLGIFSDAALTRYEAEVRQKWGHTRAYQEYEQKTKNETGGQRTQTAKQLLALFADIGALRLHSPDERAVQEKIGALQAFITAHYYTCTDQILLELSQMYVGDERMKQNIDNVGGKGTADFVHRAISFYCAR